MFPHCVSPVLDPNSCHLCPRHWTVSLSNLSRADHHSSWRSAGTATFLPCQPTAGSHGQAEEGGHTKVFTASESGRESRFCIFSWEPAQSSMIFWSYKFFLKTRSGSLAALLFRHTVCHSVCLPGLCLFSCLSDWLFDILLTFWTTFILITMLKRRQHDSSVHMAFLSSLKLTYSCVYF